MKSARIWNSWANYLINCNKELFTAHSLWLVRGTENTEKFRYLNLCALCASAVIAFLVQQTNHIYYYQVFAQTKSF